MPVWLFNLIKIKGILESQQTTRVLQKWVNVGNEKRKLHKSTVVGFVLGDYICVQNKITVNLYKKTGE